MVHEAVVYQFFQGHSPFYLSMLQEELLHPAYVLLVNLAVQIKPGPDGSAVELTVLHPSMLYHDVDDALYPFASLALRHRCNPSGP